MSTITGNIVGNAYQSLTNTILGGSDIAVVSNLTVTDSLNIETPVISPVVFNELRNLTVFEVQQLQNINTNAITNANWSHVSSLDQDLSTTSNVTFASITGALLTPDISVNTISSYTPLGQITINPDGGILYIGPSGLGKYLSSQYAILSYISSAAARIYLQGNVDISQDLYVDSLRERTAANGIICNNTLKVNTIEPASGTTVTINANATINNTLKANTIQSVSGGNITVNSSTDFVGDISSTGALYCSNLIGKTSPAIVYLGAPTSTFTFDSANSKFFNSIKNFLDFTMNGYTAKIDCTTTKSILQIGEVKCNTIVEGTAAGNINLQNNTVITGNLSVSGTFNPTSVSTTNLSVDNIYEKTAAGNINFNNVVKLDTIQGKTANTIDFSMGGGTCNIYAAAGKNYVTVASGGLIADTLTSGTTNGDLTLQANGTGKLKPMSRLYYLYYHLSSSQTITTGLFTTINYNSNNSNNTGINISAGNWTCNSAMAGLWNIQCGVEFEINNTNDRILTLLINGTTYARSNFHPSSTNSSGTTISITVPLVNGDVVRADCYQNSGGNLRISFYPANVRNTFITMTRISA